MPSTKLRAEVIHEVEAGDSPHSIVVFGQHLDPDAFWPLFRECASRYADDPARSWTLEPCADEELSHQHWSRFIDTESGDREQLPLIGEQDPGCVWWWDTAAPESGDDMAQTTPVTFVNVKREAAGGEASQ